jgi:hypothetical protein
VNILIEELRVPVETERVNRSCSCRSGVVQTVTVLVKLFIEGTKWLKRPCDIVKALVLSIEVMKVPVNAMKCRYADVLVLIEVVRVPQRQRE